MIHSLGMHDGKQEKPLFFGRVTSRSDRRIFGIRGGRFVAPKALLNFYVLHCVGFPLVAGFLMALHFWRVRKDGGISGPL